MRDNESQQSGRKESYKLGKGVASHTLTFRIVSLSIFLFSFLRPTSAFATTSKTFVDSSINALHTLRNTRGTKSNLIYSKCYINMQKSSLLMTVDSTPSDEISQQLAKAKELIALTKAKIAAAENSEGGEIKKNEYCMGVDDKRAEVIKSCDPNSGLITTDGEKMAELSEKEEWVVRKLIDDPNIDEKTGKKIKSSPLAMFNLRRKLRPQDFDKVFNKKNYFIGETE